MLAMGLLCMAMNITIVTKLLPNTAVKAAPSGRWTLRDKAPRSALYLQR
jgi:hypothetical protein